MKKLIEAGLYGRGLVKVRDHMVGRYNDALEDMGIAPTKLKEFEIDGGGWSPQIAEEKQNDCYLCHGEANPYFIIISPDQRGKPLYRPFHSFDRAAIEKIFRNASKQIATITETTSLWVNVENELAHFHSPADMLLVETVKLQVFTVGRLITAAREQRDLVTEFRDNETAWMDKRLRERIIQSAKTSGDLRYKSLVIPDIGFTEMRSFHAQAFGGVFVIRDLQNDEYILILESLEHSKLEKGGKNIFLSQDESLTPRLVDEGLIAIPLKWYAKNVHVLEGIKEALLMETVFKHDPETLLPTSPAQYKRLVAAHKEKLPEEFFELERVIISLPRTKRLSTIKISKNLARHLWRPDDGLDEHLQQVIWKLLVKRGTPCLEHLYKHDKPRFYQSFKNWPDSKQDWAIARLQNRNNSDKR